MYSKTTYLNKPAYIEKKKISTNKRNRFYKTNGFFFFFYMRIHFQITDFRMFSMACSFFFFIRMNTFLPEILFRPKIENDKSAICKSFFDIPCNSNSNEKKQ